MSTIGQDSDCDPTSRKRNLDEDQSLSESSSSSDSSRTEYNKSSKKKSKKDKHSKVKKHMKEKKGKKDKKKKQKKHKSKERSKNAEEILSALQSSLLPRAIFELPRAEPASSYITSIHKPLSTGTISGLTGDRAGKGWIRVNATKVHSSGAAPKLVSKLEALVQEETKAVSRHSS